MCTAAKFIYMGKSYSKGPLEVTMSKLTDNNKWGYSTHIQFKLTFKASRALGEQGTVGRVPLLGKD